MEGTGGFDAFSTGMGSFLLAAVIARPARLRIPPETLSNRRFHS